MKICSHLIAVMIGLHLAGISGSAAANPVENSPTNEAGPASNRLNVVFFLVDDLGWSDVGYQGSAFYRTPNVDAFAKRGVSFARAYAACPVCSPTRASILTGEYPARLHLTDWLPGRKDFPFQKLANARTIRHLPYRQPTLPEVLRENGYRTAIFGKWHLGEDPESTQRQGFDLHVPDWNKGWPNGTYFSPYGMKGLEGGPAGEYLTDRLTDEAIRWIEENRKRPFFLYLAHFAVHDPIQGRRDLVDRYARALDNAPPATGVPFVLEDNPDDPNAFPRAALDALLRNKRYKAFSLLPDRMVKIKQHQDNPEFAAMVGSMDESLGRILAKLKELKLEDNTIVIFFSDNGGMSAANFGNPHRSIPERNLNRAFSTSNLPLRGGKGWLYEGGIREPLIIYWPHHGRTGTSSDVPVISTDFYATILDMLGLRPSRPGDDGKDGMSLVPLMTGDAAGAKAVANRALYWHWPHYSNHGAQSPAGAVRYGDYKLIEYYENRTVQLFDLESDPGERHDLSDSQPATAGQLRQMLETWRTRVGADMPVPNPDYDPAARWPSGKSKS